MKALSTFLMAVSLVSITSAQAHQQSWPGKRLAELMPEAKSFSKKQTTLSPSQIGWTEKSLGESIRTEDKTPAFYTAMDENKNILGYAIFLDATGTNGNIELGVASSPDGAVSNTLLFEDNEGRALESPSFLSQFKSKKATDKFKVGTDIAAPKGSEGGAQVIASAVRRGLLMEMAGLGLTTKK